MVDFKKMNVEGLEKWGDEVIPMKLSNGNTLYYVEREGMYFEVGIFLRDKNKLEVFSNVSEGLINIILRAYKYKFRIRIFYGDIHTGRSWNEEYDVTGTIGKTTGNIKIPILLKRKDSNGGGALCLSSVIRIDDIEDKRTLWKLSNFHVEELNVCSNDSLELPWKVEKLNEETNKWQTQACFKTEIQAQRYKEFMEGERYSK